MTRKDIKGTSEGRAQGNTPVEPDGSPSPSRTGSDANATPDATGASYAAARGLRRSITPIGFFFGQSPAAQGGAGGVTEQMLYPKRHVREPWKTPTARMALSAAIAAIAGIVWFLLNIPALNLSDIGFWAMLFWICLVSGLVQVFLQGSANSPARNPFKHLAINAKGASIAMGAIAAVMVFGALAGWVVLRGQSYAELLPMEAAASGMNIAEAVSDCTVVDAQPALTAARSALVDTEALGQEYDVVPYASLDVTDDGARWVFALGQQDAMPSPGTLHQTSSSYIAVDAFTADACILDYPQDMAFSPSNILLDNANRRFRFTYPTVAYGYLHLEFDEGGTPFWVASTVERSIGLFGGTYCTGALTMDAVTGECRRYTLEDAPEWIDCLYPADLMVAQYNYNPYRNGFASALTGETQGQLANDGYHQLVYGGRVYAYAATVSTAAGGTDGWVVFDQKTGTCSSYSADEIAAAE